MFDVEEILNSNIDRELIGDLLEDWEIITQLMTKISSGTSTGNSPPSQRTPVVKPCTDLSSHKLWVHIEMNTQNNDIMQIVLTQWMYK